MNKTTFDQALFKIVRKRVRQEIGCKENKPPGERAPRYRKKCQLHFINSVNLTGLLTGLDTGSGMSIDTSYFSCCQGTGKQMDRQRNCQSQCDLLHRLAGVKGIEAAFQRYWRKAKKWPTLTLELETDLLSVLTQMITGYSRQAEIFRGRSGHPGHIWNGAIAAAWKFGLKTHCVRLAQTSSISLLPKEKSDSKPFVIVVEQVEKLWDLSILHKLEIIIGFVYRSNSFLILEIVDQNLLNSGSFDENSPEGNQCFDTRTQAAMRIAQAKAQPLAALLSREGRSRLHSLCYFPRIEEH